MGLMVLLSALLTTVPDCDTVVSVDVHHSLVAELLNEDGKRLVDKLCAVIESLTTHVSTMGDSHDQWADLAVDHKIVTYEVAVTTGGSFGAGTDANVCMQVHTNPISLLPATPAHCPSGCTIVEGCDRMGTAPSRVHNRIRAPGREMWPQCPIAHGLWRAQVHGGVALTSPIQLDRRFANDFERHQTNKFRFRWHDLGELRKIRVWHDSAFLGSAWQLEKVYVSIVDDSGVLDEEQKWLFLPKLGEEWLDRCAGDRKTERHLSAQLHPHPDDFIPSRQLSRTRRQKVKQNGVGSDEITPLAQPCPTGEAAALGRPFHVKPAPLISIINNLIAAFHSRQTLEVLVELQTYAAKCLVDRGPELCAVVRKSGFPAKRNAFYLCQLVCEGQYEVGQQALLDSGLFGLLCDELIELDVSVVDGATLDQAKEGLVIPAKVEKPATPRNGVAVVQADGTNPWDSVLSSVVPEPEPEPSAIPPVSTLQVEMVVQAAVALAEAMQGPNKPCQQFAAEKNVDTKVLSFFHRSRTERYKYCEMTQGMKVKKKRRKGFLQPASRCKSLKGRCCPCCTDQENTEFVESALITQVNHCNSSQYTGPAGAHAQPHTPSMTRCAKEFLLSSLIFCAGPSETGMLMAMVCVQAGYVMCLEFSLLKIAEAMLEGKTLSSEVYRQDPLGLGFNADRTLDCLVTQLRYYKDVDQKESDLFTVWDPVLNKELEPQALRTLLWSISDRLLSFLPRDQRDRREPRCPRPLIQNQRIDDLLIRSKALFERWC